MRGDRAADQSGVWLPWIAIAGWLAGAAGCIAWMFEGGGFARPATVFAVWAMVLFVVESFGPARRPVSTLNSALAKTMRFGLYSVIALLLGYLFVQYWPVTLSMAIMFAICRRVETDDVPAYN